MHPLPHTVPTVSSVDSPWLPPIQFGLKPYLGLCRSFDEALTALETRFPSPRRVLTIEARNKRIRRKPK